MYKYKYLNKLIVTQHVSWPVESISCDVCLLVYVCQYGLSPAFLGDVQVFQSFSRDGKKNLFEMYNGDNYDDDKDNNNKENMDNDDQIKKNLAFCNFFF